MLTYFPAIANRMRYPIGWRAGGSAPWKLLDFMCAMLNIDNLGIVIKVGKRRHKITLSIQLSLWYRES